MNDDRISRRAWMRNTAGAGAGWLLAGLGARAAETTVGKDKLALALIGAGSQGSRDLAAMATENVVALCDVDPRATAKLAVKYPQARVYTDYRALLEKEKALQAVIVGTPDHTHAVIAADVIRRGVHVYCEKPLCHDIFECRQLAAVAAAAPKVITQMGIQGHSGEGLRRVCEWVEAGVLGDVCEVDAWCSLSYYPPGRAWWCTPVYERPTETPELPAGLDWDRWLGPAPKRPYHPAYHPGKWRAWWDFGCGMMGDRGVHTLDAVVSSLRLGLPISVDAVVMGGNAETHPLAAVVTFRFAARDGLPPVKINWYEGLPPPRPAELEDGRSLPPEGGFILHGSQASLMAELYSGSPRIFPEAKMRELAPSLPPPRLPRVPEGHHVNFLRACRGEVVPQADFAYAAHLTEICLLGNVAKRFPEIRLNYDGAAGRVTNHAPANDWIRRPRRTGWEL